MKFVVILSALISISHAQATTHSSFVGTKIAARGAQLSTCALTTTEYNSIKLNTLVRSAVVEGISFELTPKFPGDCRVMVSNPYPEGPYGSTLLLKVNFDRDCQTVLSYDFTSGMKMGQAQGYSCGQMRLIP